MTVGVSVTSEATGTVGTETSAPAKTPVAKASLHEVLEAWIRAHVVVVVVVVMRILLVGFAAPGVGRSHR